MATNQKYGPTRTRTLPVPEGTPTGAPVVAGEFVAATLTAEKNGTASCALDGAFGFPWSGTDDAMDAGDPVYLTPDGDLVDDPADGDNTKFGALLEAKAVEAAVVLVEVGQAAAGAGAGGGGGFPPPAIFLGSVEGVSDQDDIPVPLVAVEDLDDYPQLPDFFIADDGKVVVQQDCLAMVTIEGQIFTDFSDTTAPAHVRSEVAVWLNDQSIAGNNNLFRFSSAGEIQETKYETLLLVLKADDELAVFAHVTARDAEGELINDGTFEVEGAIRLSPQGG